VEGVVVEEAVDFEDIPLEVVSVGTPAEDSGVADAEEEDQEEVAAEEEEKLKGKVHLWRLQENPPPKD